MRWVCLLVLLPMLGAAQGPRKPSAVYSRTSFPGQEINPLLDLIDWDAGSVNGQYLRLRDSAGLVPAQTQAPLFYADILLQPVRTKTLFLDGTVLVKGQSLSAQVGYLERPDTPALFSILPHSGESGLTVWLPRDSQHRVWIKDPLDAARYAIKEGTGGETVAGYPCREVLFTAKNNTLTQVNGKLYSFPPLKLRLLYTEALDASMNIQLPYRLNWKGGVLRLEAWLDAEGTKKLVHEVTSLNFERPSREEFSLPAPVPMVRYRADSEGELLMHLITLAGTLSMSM